MQKLISAVILLLVAIPANAYECKAGYSTTIAVQDPDGKAVSGANVTLTLLCDNNRTTSHSTDDSGEATFPYSLDDLGEIKITLAGFRATAIDKSACSGPDTAKRCVIRFGT